MLSIQSQHVYKRFQREWIIDDFNHLFEAGSRTGISGPNGKGKSTLLKLLAGFMPVSEGKIIYELDQKSIDVDDLYLQMSFSAPYISLNKELYIKELYNLISTNKEMYTESEKAFTSLVYLEKDAHKPIKEFSDGMRQRLHLALAILCKTPLLFLDEPSTYLDHNAKKWMMDLLKSHAHNRTIIIASNDPFDFEDCSDVIEI